MTGRSPLRGSIQADRQALPRSSMPNGRCKLHGGKSTGPRTPEGLERSRRANWKHGDFSRVRRWNGRACGRQYLGSAICATRSNGWMVISIKNDSKRIFAFE
jgi:hypothetical protein